jgi:hypothetical protein
MPDVTSLRIIRVAACPLVALAVHGDSQIRYDFVSGDQDKLENLHRLLKLLRSAHALVLEDLYRAAPEAMPAPPDITKCN